MIEQLEITEWDEITEITNINNEDVYDLSVDNVHNFFANDLLVHNCGEIVLSPYDSCRLIVLDLTKFVENPFTENAKFNHIKFNKITQKAQRLMDDLVDLELEAVEKIYDKILTDPEDEETKRIELNLWKKIREIGGNGRRTGLGITGMGDALAMLNVQYGSEESIRKVESIYCDLALGAYRSTVNLAKERGAFPAYDYQLEKDHPFINQIMNLDDNLKNDWQKYGRRNIALTTTAPAGCVEKNTLLKTDHGDLTIQMLFEKNGINISDLKDMNNIWFDAISNIKIMDINGKYQKISKLYWNGKVSSKEFTFSNKEKIKTSLTHKFLVKISSTTAKWVSASELKIGDKILSIK